ncbi:MAG: hypothetical protein ABL904_26310, partial [Hyphomicrobiaceae bacterium]
MKWCDAQSNLCAAGLMSRGLKRARASHVIGSSALALLKMQDMLNTVLQRRKIKVINYVKVMRSLFEGQTMALWSRNPPATPVPPAPDTIAPAA